jgi:hypothetical protein
MCAWRAAIVIARGLSMNAGERENRATLEGDFDELKKSEVRRRTFIDMVPALAWCVFAGWRPGIPQPTISCVHRSLPGRGVRIGGSPPFTWTIWSS